MKEFQTNQMVSAYKWTCSGMAVLYRPPFCLILHCMFSAPGYTVFKELEIKTASQMKNLGIKYSKFMCLNCNDSVIHKQSFQNVARPAMKIEGDNEKRLNYASLQVVLVFTNQSRLQKLLHFFIWTMFKRDPRLIIFNF